MSTAPEYRQHRFQLQPDATEFILVRHGESAPVRAGEPFALSDDGHGDPDLSALGEWQAERVGERLADEKIDALYVTNLKRTLQTATPLITRVGLEPVVETELRECYLGEWEGGIYRVKAAQADPLFIKAMRDHRWDVIPGAERDEDFWARTTGTINRLAEAHQGERVALFIHAGVIAALIQHATGCRPFAFLYSDNGSISHLVVQQQVWTVRRFNDTGHLDELSAEAEPPI